jgi:hypothetical protein
LKVFEKLDGRQNSANETNYLAKVRCNLDCINPA